MQVLPEHFRAGFNFIQLRPGRVVFLCQSLQAFYLALIVGDIRANARQLGFVIAQLQLQQVIIYDRERITLRNLIPNFGYPLQSAIEFRGNFSIALADNSAGQAHH
jgi:hypothetical protein